MTKREVEQIEREVLDAIGRSCGIHDTILMADDQVSLSCKVSQIFGKHGVDCCDGA